MWPVGGKLGDTQSPAVCRERAVASLARPCVANVQTCMFGNARVNTETAHVNTCEGVCIACVRVWVTCMHRIYSLALWCPPTVSEGAAAMQAGPGLGREG